MADLTEHNNALAKRAADFADLQQEISGNTGGKSERFLSPATREIRDQEKHGQKNKADQTLRDLLRTNAAYRAAYETFGQKLRQAELLIEGALDQIAEKLDAARDQLSDIRENAARAPDGTRLYQDENGQIWTEDGRNMDHLQGVAVFPENAPSYENFKAKRDQLEALRQREAELIRIQVDVLGAARDRYHDEDEPITRAEIDDFEKEISEILQTPELQISAPQTDMSVTAPVTHFELPTLGS